MPSRLLCSSILHMLPLLGCRFATGATEASI
jgi:hypothetical protein